MLILAKHYGYLDKNDLSVTHNEFRTAREGEIPIVTLVDHDILTFYQVYRANIGQVPAFPGMDAPERTFALLEEIKGSNVNNGILPFSTVSEARTQIRRQIAHLVGELFRQQFDPIGVQIRNLRSELKTLRHDIRPAPPDDNSMRFFRAAQFLLSDRRRGISLGEFAEHIAGSIDAAIPHMMNAPTFDDFVRATEHSLMVDDNIDVIGLIRANEIRMARSFCALDEYSAVTQGLDDEGKVVIPYAKEVHMNQLAHDWYSQTFDSLRQIIDGSAKLTQQ